MELSPTTAVTFVGWSSHFREFLQTRLHTVGYAMLMRYNKVVVARMRAAEATSRVSFKRVPTRPEAFSLFLFFVFSKSPQAHIIGL